MRALFVLSAAALCFGEPVLAASETRWSAELKARYRSSDAARFRLGFPFGPDQLPPGADGVDLATVDEGDHLEFVAATIEIEREWEAAAFAIKVDAVDLDDRNPTSTAREYDLDELWFRFGRESEPAVVPERRQYYAKFGKFPHFERQDDRHLESYGMVATAFNRQEDVGIEFGVDLTRHWYLKASYTEGNPLFLRDPNALAGDNGTPVLLTPNPAPEFQSGIPIPYDADVEEVGFEQPQLSIGMGVRFSDGTGFNGVDVLVWTRERDLAATIEVDGSFYGADLDQLLGPLNLFPFPITSDRKREDGINVWWYSGGFSFFGQYVDQDLAGLPRTGTEFELAWRKELPPFWAAGGRQILPSIAPAVRYSELDPDFAAPATTPSPSFSWDWEKWDYGLRVGLIGDSDLTIEYSDNAFVLASGAERGLDELLVTLRLRFGS